jgi:hypothetical protein
MKSVGIVPLIAIFLLLPGCSSSSPVPESIFLSGTITYQGSEWHSLPLTKSGIVEIDVRTLQPQLIDVTNINELDLFLGLGVGQPSGDNCNPSTRTAIRQGDQVVFGLGVKEYCILVFDSGALPEDATIRYTLELSSDS